MSSFVSFAMRVLSIAVLVSLLTIAIVVDSLPSEPLKGKDRPSSSSTLADVLLRRAENEEDGGASDHYDMASAKLSFPHDHTPDGRGYRKFGEREQLEGAHSRLFQLQKQEELRILIHDRRQEIKELQDFISRLKFGLNNNNADAEAEVAPPAPRASRLPLFGNGRIPESSDHYFFVLEDNHHATQIAEAETKLRDLEISLQILEGKIDRTFDNPKALQIPRKYNRDEGLSPRDAKSIFVSFEISASGSNNCQGRVATARYLPDEVPSFFNWVPLPHKTNEHSVDSDLTAVSIPPSKALFDLVQQLPEGALAETADYDPVGIKLGRSPALFMLTADMKEKKAAPSNESVSNEEKTTKRVPHGYLFVDPRFIHVHDPDRAPQTHEEVAKHLARQEREQHRGENKDVDVNAGDESEHAHHDEAHHKHSHTDSYYVAETGTVDLWVPADTEYLTLYCDGNATDYPLRVPIFPHLHRKRLSAKRHNNKNNRSVSEDKENDDDVIEQSRNFNAQDASNTEYREIHVVGPPSNVLNVVFISGCFLASGRERFFQQVKDVYDILVDKELDNKYSGGMDDPSHDMHASVPHNRYLNFWNVFAVFQPSNEEGPSRPRIGVTTDNNLKCVHPAEVERGLQCNWDLARALAAVAPVNMQGQPGRTLVITLVNSPLYGGTGQHIFGSRNFCNFFNGYDLSDVQQKQKMISLMNHEIGHALGGLVDEYLAYSSNNNNNLRFANCQQGLAEGNNPPPSSTVRWRWWVDRLVESPSAFFSTYSDRIKTSSWGMLQTPVSPCLYNNYYRPTDYCMMNRLNNYAMCPVCREAATVEEMRLGFDLQYPRKPLEDHIVVVLTNTTDKNVLNINSNFTIHLSRVLTPANNFLVTLTDYDGASIPLTTEDADLCPACFVLRAQNFAKYPLNEVVTLTVRIADNTKFVQDPALRQQLLSEQPDQLSQTAKYRFLVTDKNPSTFVRQPIVVKSSTKYDTSGGREFSSAEDSAAPVTVITNVTLVVNTPESEVGSSRHDFISYYASCRPADGTEEGLCSMNFTNNVYTTPTKLDDDIAQYDIWAIALVAGLAVLFLIGWFWQCVRSRDRERGVIRPIFKVKFSFAIQLIRILMMAAAVGLMFASIAALAMSAYFYTKLSVLGKLLIYVGLIVAVPLYGLAFFGFSAIASRSKRMLMINGLLLTIALAAVVVALYFVYKFVNGVIDKQDEELEWMAELWKKMVSSDPSQLCAIQNELRCTGWNTSCIAVFGVTDECPTDCDVINNKYPRSCGSLITDLIVDYGPYLLYVIYAAAGMLVVGIAFDITTWISLFLMKLAIRNKNQSKIQTQTKCSSLSPAQSKKYAALLLLMSLSSSDTRQLTREFKRIDKDGSGTLDKLEMLLFFKKALCHKATEEEINEIFAIADVDNDRTINLKEFLALFQTAGGGSSPSDRSSMIIRQRLAERGLLNRMEMAHREAVNKNGSGGGGKGRVGQYSPRSPTAAGGALQAPMLPNTSPVGTPRASGSPNKNRAPSPRPDPSFNL